MDTAQKPVPENIQAIVDELNVNGCHSVPYHVKAYLYKEARNNIGDRHDEWRLAVVSRKTGRTVVENLQWNKACWHTYAVMISGFDREARQLELEAQFETIRSFTSTMVEAIGQRPRIYDQFIVDKYVKPKEE